MSKLIVIGKEDLKKVMHQVFAELYAKKIIVGEAHAILLEKIDNASIAQVDVEQLKNIFGA